MQRLKHLCRKIIIILLVCLAPQPALAAGEKLIEAVLLSDFIIDRDVSNVPFFPLGYLSANYNDSIEFEDCSSTQTCNFSYLSVSQGLGAPVWIGKKDMVLLGETLEFDQIETGGRALELTTGGLLAAWVQQTNQKWQLAAFIYAYDSLKEDAEFEPPRGNYAGFIGRYRHDKRVHSLWGVVRADELDDPVWLPYAGFSWFIGKEWLISMVLPWPSVSYAPSTNEVYRLGATFSGSDWAIDSDGQILRNSFSKVDLGFSYERRISQIIWLEARVGYSGFGRFTVDTDSNVDLEADVANNPFISLAIVLRPGI
jgi:hypothetical protein